MTQTLIIHVIRTNKIPFLQSRASWPLTVTTISIMALGMWLPYSPLGGQREPSLQFQILRLGFDLLGIATPTSARGARQAAARVILRECHGFRPGGAKLFDARLTAGQADVRDR